MNAALLRFVGAELWRARIRSGLAAIALALALLAIAFFDHEIAAGRAALAHFYIEAGATRFLVELRGVDAKATDALAHEAAHLPAIAAAAAWTDGIAAKVPADTSFLVFANQRQREFLGARTAAIGVGSGFDQRADYITKLVVADSTLGIPLLPVAGEARPPRDGEVLVSAAVADYVGVRPGTTATVELRYDAADPPVVRRLEGLRLIGTFDVAGPDHGRFEPFWRLTESDKAEILTVRHPAADRLAATTVPVLLAKAALRDFLAQVRAQGAEPAPAERLTLRAPVLDGVPATEQATTALLRAHGLEQTCAAGDKPSFCIRVPIRNNFATALQEQSKLAAGEGYFIGLLLVLVAVGSGALQIQTAMARWRECGVLRALGFGAAQVTLIQAAPLAAALLGGLILALIGTTLAGFAGAPLWSAVAAAATAASFAAVPGLILATSIRPTALLRELS